MEISKRDYFASQALAGLLASNRPDASPQTLAAEAFEYADAMLKLSKTLGDPIEIDPDQLGKRIGGGDPVPKIGE